MHFGVRTSTSQSPTEEPSLSPLPVTLANLLRQTGPLSIITLVDTCLNEACSLRASDIHLEPTAQSVRVRFRIDGVLADVGVFPLTSLQEVITRIKVLAHLRTDEHQAAQDGRFRTVLHAGNNLDVRVSIVPTYYGENAILRLLSEHESPLTLHDLGLSDNHQKLLERAITQPNGMILVTGPTGSGKTSTLYTLLQLLHRREISIITLEDPIEYAIAGITQVQINQRSQLTFANGLRSILRQDPDVIMVGEIRDNETAALAVNTALTGHLMLSTLHTNDAASTLPRLLDMGIDAYLVASTVRITIGQRLVRKLCTNCTETHILTPAELYNVQRALALHAVTTFSETPTQFYRSKGCAACKDTGYQGRTGIYEILVTTPRVREAIVRRATATDIKRIAIEEHMTTMFEDGLAKALAGTTSLSEIIRTIATE